MPSCRVPTRRVEVWIVQYALVALRNLRCSIKTLLGEPPPFRPSQTRIYSFLVFQWHTRKKRKNCHRHVSSMASLPLCPIHTTTNIIAKTKPHFIVSAKEDTPARDTLKFLVLPLFLLSMSHVAANLVVPLCVALAVLRKHTCRVESDARVSPLRSFVITRALLQRRESLI